MSRIARCIGIGGFPVLGDVACSILGFVACSALGLSLVSLAQGSPSPAEGSSSASQGPSPSPQGPSPSAQGSPSAAQASRPGGDLVLFAPGDKVVPEILLAGGGPAGRDLAPLVGKDVLLLVYWRPRDWASERALTRAVRNAPRGVTVFPVAVIATTQPKGDVAERLKATGLESLPPRQDQGDLGLRLGVEQVPCLVLLDRSGVVRAAGGVDIGQNGPTGWSILDAAAALAARPPADGVPTLGVLKHSTAYRLAGEKFPEMGVVELDSDRAHNLADLFPAGKRVLVVYWSPQCPHCRDALPKLAAWYAKRPEDLVVIDVARAEFPTMADEARKIVSPYPWIHLLDTQRFGNRALLASETPAAYLVGTDRAVTGVHTGGGIDWERWLGTR
jgi:thiol-disulfide isomerase/thioredoxin